MERISHLLIKEATPEVAARELGAKLKLLRLQNRHFQLGNIVAQYAILIASLEMFAKVCKCEAARGACDLGSMSEPEQSVQDLYLDERRLAAGAAQHYMSHAVDG